MSFYPQGSNPQSRRFVPSRDISSGELPGAMAHSKTKSGPSLKTQQIEANRLQDHRSSNQQPPHNCQISHPQRTHEANGQGAPLLENTHGAHGARPTSNSRKEAEHFNHQVKYISGASDQVDVDQAEAGQNGDKEYYYVSTEGPAQSEREAILKKPEEQHALLAHYHSSRKVPVCSAPAEAIQVGAGQVYYNPSGSYPAELGAQYPIYPSHGQLPDGDQAGLEAGNYIPDFYSSMAPRLEEPRVPPTVGMKGLRHYQSYQSGSKKKPAAAQASVYHQSAKERARIEAISNPFSQVSGRSKDPFPLSAKMARKKSREVPPFGGSQAVHGSIDQRFNEADFNSPANYSPVKSRTMNYQSLGGGLAEQRSFERTIYEGQNPSYLSKMEQHLSETQSRSSLARVYGRTYISPQAQKPAPVGAKKSLKKNRRLVAPRQPSSNLSKKQKQLVRPAHELHHEGNQSQYLSLEGTNASKMNATLTEVRTVRTVRSAKKTTSQLLSEKSRDSNLRKTSKNPSQSNTGKRVSSNEKVDTAIDPENLVVEVSLMPLVNELVQKKTRTASKQARERLRAEAEKVKELEKLIQVIKRDEEAKISMLKGKVSTHKATLDKQKRQGAALEARLTKAEAAVASKADEVLTLTNLCLELQKKVASKHQAAKASEVPARNEAAVQTAAGQEEANQDKKEEALELVRAVLEASAQTEELPSTPMSPGQPREEPSPPQYHKYEEVLQENKKLKKVATNAEVEMGALQEQLAESVVEILELKIQLEQKTSSLKNLESEFKIEKEAAERNTTKLQRTIAAFESSVSKLTAQKGELQGNLDKARSKQEAQSRDIAKLEDKARVFGEKNRKLKETIAELEAQSKLFPTKAPDSQEAEPPSTTTDDHSATVLHLEDRVSSQAKELAACFHQISSLEAALKEKENSSSILLKENLALEDEAQAARQAKAFSLGLVLKTVEAVRQQSRSEHSRPAEPFEQERKVADLLVVVASLQNDLEGMKQSSDEKQAEIYQLTRELASAQEQLHDGAAHREELQRQNDELQASYDQLITQNEAQPSQLESSPVQLPSPSAEEQESQDEEQEDYDQEKQELQNQVEKLEKQLSEKAKQIAALQATVEDVNQKHENSLSDEFALRAEVVELEKQIAEAEEKARGQHKEGNGGGKDEKILKLNGQIAELSATLSQILSENELLKQQFKDKALDGQEQKHDDKKLLEKDQELATDRVAELEGQVALLEGQVASLEGQVASLEDQITTLSREAADLASSKEKQAKLSSENSKLKDALEEASRLKEDLEQEVAQLRKQVEVNKKPQRATQKDEDSSQKMTPSSKLAAYEAQVLRLKTQIQEEQFLNKEQQRELRATQELLDEANSLLRLGQVHKGEATPAFSSPNRVGQLTGREFRNVQMEAGLGAQGRSILPPGTELLKQQMEQTHGHRAEQAEKSEIQMKLQEIFDVSIEQLQNQQREEERKNEGIVSGQLTFR